MLEKVVITSNQEAHSLEMFGTNLEFQQRDFAFGISFHREIVTKGPPPKCF